MHSKAQSLMKAHTEFLLARCSVQELPATLQTEITLLIAHLSQRKLHELVDHAQVLRLLQQELLQRQPAPGLRNQLKASIQRLLHNPILNQTEIGMILGDEDAERVMNTLLKHEDLRKDIVHSLLASPVYSDVLSDLLYHSIKDYLLEENVLTKKVPGMASLMKIGKGMVERMGNLEESFEKTIKQYIRKNIRASVELSEQLIDKAFQGPRLREALRDALGQLRQQKIALIGQHIQSHDIEEGEEILNSLWNRWRETPTASAVLEDLVQHWFELHTDQTLGQLLAELDFDILDFSRELEAAASPVISLLRDNGYLQSRIESHLQPFYASDAVHALLGPE